MYEIEVCCVEYSCGWSVLDLLLSLFFDYFFLLCVLKLGNDRVVFIYDGLVLKRSRNFFRICL